MLSFSCYIYTYIWVETLILCSWTNPAAISKSMALYTLDTTFYTYNKVPCTENSQLIYRLKTHTYLAMISSCSGVEVRGRGRALYYILSWRTSFAARARSRIGRRVKVLLKAFSWEFYVGSVTDFRKTIELARLSYDIIIIGICTFNHEWKEGARKCIRRNYPPSLCLRSWRHCNGNTRPLILPLALVRHSLSSIA